MKKWLPKPSDSPGEDIEAWRAQRQEYVDASWDEVSEEIDSSREGVKAEIEREPFWINGGSSNHNKIPPQQTKDFSDDAHEDPGDVSNVDGELPPLVGKGQRVMVCIDYELRQTRYALKDYLKWIDENTGHLFHQFFHHSDKYPVGSKAVRNYIVAMGERPKRLDRMSLRKLVGLRAEVFVETVKPEYSLGALKGQTMPESMHYSKVAEIICPLGRVDTNTLNQLRERC